MESNTAAKAYPMNSGDGNYSYTKNSSLQRRLIDATNKIINKAIAEKLDIEKFSSSNTFRVADLGCAVGPNTFFAVQNIIEAVKLKYQCHKLDSQLPEFQVFFSDNVSNDFNMLFASLPPNRQYYAAGVPGSFYSRLFPDASIHLIYSSFALHWMSRIPQEVVDNNSPAWNKGKIHYLNAKDEVVEAFKEQYKKDMECFLHARAQEVVCGGFMVILVPGYPDGILHSESLRGRLYDLLVSCLMDMAKKGIIREEKVDSFNIPMYQTSPQELEEAVERNGCFSIEKSEIIQPETPETFPEAKIIAAHMRAAMEALFKEQFGEEILDELFELFCKKFEESESFLISGKVISLFVILKRKERN